MTRTLPSRLQPIRRQPGHRQPSREAALVAATPHLELDVEAGVDRFVQLPIDLAEGDEVRLLSAGAYTSCCSSAGFNGFAPLRTRIMAS